jgi:hypothetical protein
MDDDKFLNAFEYWEPSMIVMTLASMSFEIVSLETYGDFWMTQMPYFENLAANYIWDSDSRFKNGILSFSIAYDTSCSNVFNISYWTRSYVVDSIWSIFKDFILIFESGFNVPSSWVILLNISGN